jgi:hypothetical protein
MIPCSDLNMSKERFQFANSVKDKIKISLHTCSALGFTQTVRELHHQLHAHRLGLLSYRLAKLSLLELTQVN